MDNKLNAILRMSKISSYHKLKLQGSVPIDEKLNLYFKILGFPPRAAHLQWERKQDGTHAFKPSS